MFRQFVVEFADGVIVDAKRDGENLLGGYRMRLRLPDGVEKTVDWITGPDKSVKGTAQGDQEEAEFMKYLQGLNTGLYFLTDNRKIFSTRHYDDPEEISPEYMALRRHRDVRVHQSSDILRRTVERLEAKSSEAAIEVSVFRASSWATQQALRASTKGDEDANAIFTNIVKRIVRHHGKVQLRSGRVTKEKLITELQALEKRSLEFSRYGLIAPTNIASLIQSVESAQKSALPTINDVIKPFVDSLSARINAYRPVHDSIEAFVHIVNSFFHDKRIEFFLGRGLSIVTPEGQNLSPSSLSSGERQLLLLFSNLLVVSKQNTIFIVDEPELSLNVKWQRQLVKHLFHFTQGTNVQFVLATHSIELLSAYKESVVRLTPISDSSVI